jgi:hypothetical protein
MKTAYLIITAAVLAASPALAETVEVEITGSVEYNQVTFGPLADVNPGDPAVWSFLLDSDVFVDSPTYPTRAYEINQPSFSLTLGSVELGLQDPFPGTPYFVLRDNDPAVDGFFFSTGADWPADLPLDEPGALGQFAAHFELGYTGDTLASLDILDAMGSYDYTGIQSFYTVVMDGWAEPIGLIFEQMTIVPEPGTLSLLSLLGLLGVAIRRRR